MTRRERIIKTIGDRLTGDLFKLDNEFGYEEDTEFGCFEAKHSVSMNVYDIDVDCTVEWPYRSSVSIKVILYGAESIHPNRYKKLDCLQQAVQVYMNDHLDTDSILSAMCDKLRKASEDEWEAHGFRDAADYYRYRYG